MNASREETSESGPSRLSHLYRLAVVLVVFFIVAVLVGWWATPASWNYELENWYRRDAVLDHERLPMIYGGNESCAGCHEEASKMLAQYRHRGLSCESCHGPLADHVRENKKIAAALVDRSQGQCENCHAEQINRPADFPQFSKTGEIGKEVKKHMQLEDGTPCLKCHDAHDPEA